MKRIYFDYNATTPIDPAVARTISETWSDMTGNPSSIHQEGQKARQFLEKARRQVAGLLRAPAEQVFFTSGGTESNNLVILSRIQPDRKIHVVSTVAEHPSILKPLMRLQALGKVHLDLVALLPNGALNLDQFSEMVRPDTDLITIMGVNNEIGSIFPIRELVALARAKAPNVFFHTDAIQVVGRLPVIPCELGVNALSLSGHKFYAPKGVGALWTDSEDRLTGLQLGGGQEGGLRAGTENLPGIVGLGKAAEVAMHSMDALQQALLPLREGLEERILQEIPGSVIQGRHTPRIFSTVNVRFQGVPGDILQQALDLDGIAVSTGSACSSGMVAASGVLTALGLSPKEAKEAIRISLGAQVKGEDVERLFLSLQKSVQQIRASL